MEQNDFENKIRAVAEVKDRPIDTDGVRIRHYAYKDYGGLTVDSLKPCTGDCADCGKLGECNPRRSHRRVADGWQSYCSGCARYKNRVTGRYEIKSAAGKKTIL
jgi:hypothetical protein